MKIELERVFMDRTSKLEGSTLTVYSGLPHDLCATYNDQINTDLLKLYEGHFHDLLNDVDKEVVMADIKRWIDARVSAPCQIATTYVVSAFIGGPCTSRLSAAGRS